MQGNYRSLSPSSIFDGLIPPALGTKVSKGNGNTFHSLKVMEDIAVENSDQAMKIAPLFRGNTLASTVRSVKDFLYNNFQYLADTEVQQIRTLSRAWKDRESGIDCKSYSVIGSQILQQLGIPHYFRKIKQAGGGSGYSHVYLIVPKEDFNPRVPTTYYVIDGVPSYHHEPNFIEFRDHKVRFNNQEGLGIVITTSLVVSAASVLASINWNAIGKKLKCWGSSFDADQAKKFIGDMNSKALKMEAEGKSPEMIIAHYRAQVDNRRYHLSKAKNSCTKENHKVVIDAANMVISKFNKEIAKTKSGMQPAGGGSRSFFSKGSRSAYNINANDLLIGGSERAYDTMAIDPNGAVKTANAFGTSSSAVNAGIVLAICAGGYWAWKKLNQN